MEYRCNYCGKVFESDWSDEDAFREAELLFGSRPDEWNEPYAVVCDDCFQEMRRWELIEEAKRAIEE